MKNKFRIKSFHHLDSWPQVVCFRKDKPWWSFESSTTQQFYWSFLMYQKLGEKNIPYAARKKHNYCFLMCESLFPNPNMLARSDTRHPISPTIQYSEKWPIVPTARKHIPIAPTAHLSFTLLVTFVTQPDSVKKCLYITPKPPTARHIFCIQRA